MPDVCVSLSKTFHSHCQAHPAVYNEHLEFASWMCRKSMICCKEIFARIVTTLHPFETINCEVMHDNCQEAVMHDQFTYLDIIAQ